MPAPQSPGLTDPSFWTSFVWDDPRYKDDPYPWFDRMREQSPVHRTDWGLWRVCRHADVLALLRHAQAGKRTRDGELPLFPRQPGRPRDPLELDRGRFMLHQDPPAHTRLRRLVSRAFTPRAVERLRPRIERLVDELLQRVASTGGMDVVADLALPVPATVICEMLGIPAADRAQFSSWTADSTFGLLGRLAGPERARRAEGAVRHLVAYFAKLIEERSRELGDDMLSDMIRAADDGDRLSTEELFAQAIGLLVAGFETTIGLIGNGVRALIQHPDELAKLREEPERIDSAVEECLRFDGPVLLAQRVVREEVELSGVRIPADAGVLLSLASANRDPEVFQNPGRFDVERTPNEHLAFGGGVHFCLGSHLARLEARAAIGGLVERFDKLELVESRIEWGGSLFRVLGRLPVRFRERR